MRALVQTVDGVFEVDLAEEEVLGSVEGEIRPERLEIPLPLFVAGAATGSTVVAVIDRRPPLVVSNDAGRTWRESGGGLPPGRAVAVADDDPDLMLYAARNRLYLSEDEVAALRPDFSALAGAPAVLGINCITGSGTRWKTRMFSPGGGFAEDPATGSAAGPLAVHAARHGRIGFGEEIEISQGTEVGRPSLLYARADGSAEQLEAVEVGGSAVIVARGEFRLPK